MKKCIKLSDQGSPVYSSLRDIRKLREKHLSQAEKEYTSRKGQAIVRFIKPYPAIEGLSTKKYGPFLSGDLAILPMETVRTLLKEGVIRIVHARL